ncbi:MAG TPA: hypothetical protein VNI77_07435 [Nitrososphaera sp.]|nr:hypothetical protein [Nitrososphaera sp.]
MMGKILTDVVGGTKIVEGKTSTLKRLFGLPHCSSLLANYGIISPVVLKALGTQCRSMGITAKYSVQGLIEQ